MITVTLQGGLGNQLFQLATAFHVARLTDRQVQIDPRHINRRNPHSSQDYTKTIFRNIRFGPVQVSQTLFEDDSWSLITTKENLSMYNHLHGYFQKYYYVNVDFHNILTLPIMNALSNTAFLSIRGGDYLKNPHHRIPNTDLVSYYKRCLEKLPTGTHVLVFTNDMSYARQIVSCLQGLSWSFDSHRDEVEAMASMVSCKIGGILTNSSFSWWASYLGHRQHPEAKYFAPKPWFPVTSQYRFNDVSGLYGPWMVPVDL